jgi:hypothetical protein
MTKESPAFQPGFPFLPIRCPIMPAAVAWSGMVPHGVALTGLLLMLRVEKPEVAQTAEKTAAASAHFMFLHIWYHPKS